jgi:chromosome segregation ATPase
MTQQPKNTDAVLGGIQGVKQRLQAPEEEVREEALHQALNYGEEGLALVIAALEDESLRVSNTAHELLLKQPNPSKELKTGIKKSLRRLEHDVSEKQKRLDKKEKSINLGQKKEKQIDDWLKTLKDLAKESQELEERISSLQAEEEKVWNKVKEKLDALEAYGEVFEQALLNGETPPLAPGFDSDSESSESAKERFLKTL